MFLILRTWNTDDSALEKEELKNEQPVQENESQEGIKQEEKALKEFYYGKRKIVNILVISENQSIFENGQIDKRINRIKPNEYSEIWLNRLFELYKLHQQKKSEGETETNLSWEHLSKNLEGLFIQQEFKLLEMIANIGIDFSEKKDIIKILMISLLNFPTIIMSPDLAICYFQKAHSFWSPSIVIIEEPNLVSLTRLQLLLQMETSKLIILHDPVLDNLDRPKHHWADCLKKQGHFIIQLKTTQDHLPERVQLANKMFYNGKWRVNSRLNSQTSGIIFQRVLFKQKKVFTPFIDVRDGKEIKVKENDYKNEKEILAILMCARLVQEYLLTIWKRQPKYITPEHVPTFWIFSPYQSQREELKKRIKETIRDILAPFFKVADLDEISCYSKTSFCLASLVRTGKNRIIDDLETEKFYAKCLTIPRIFLMLIGQAEAIAQNPSGSLLLYYLKESQQVYTLEQIKLNMQEKMAEDKRIFHFN